MYFELLKELVPLDRCHCGPEMEIAYQKLVAHYPGSTLLKYGAKDNVNSWRRPPSWVCKSGELVDDNGNVIASRDLHKLSVYTYSPPIDEVISYQELEGHLLSDPNRPDAICFHFRNQYRHWAPEWGFSIPHKVREQLCHTAKYHVKIESDFDANQDLIQSDYHHRGQSDATFLFIGHFDHPAQANDGLAGCIAAYEIIRRLQNRETRFSYRAFASVEIIGSVYYLDGLGDQVQNIREGMFLGLSGIGSPLVYQQSYRRNSLLDRITRFLMSFYGSGEGAVYRHRELIGNDENVFDSVGYEIPTGTLMRWPFPHYHTDSDSLENTSKDSLEEVIDFGLRIIDVIENNYYLKSNYIGLPSLANPSIDLYLSPDAISGVDLSVSHAISRYQAGLPSHELEYLKNNSNRLNQFMQNMVRLSDGKHSILDLAEISRIPFGFVLKYASLMKERGLITFEERSA